MIFIQDKWTESTISSNHISQFTTAVRSVLHNTTIKPESIILIYNTKPSLSKPAQNILDVFTPFLISNAHYLIKIEIK